MNLSICFAPGIVLNKISYSFFMISRVIKSDGKSILFAVIIILLLRAIIDQGCEHSCLTNLSSQTLKKTPLFLHEKGVVLENLTSQNSELAERTELMKSQIEMALLSHESR